MEKFDFSGWATRANLKCSDGRIIMKDAFKHNDGQTVPLVWNHQHNEATNVLGHALLKNLDDGVYAYCRFNDSEPAKHAKTLVEHGDIKALSIFANRLRQDGANVMHGDIREVSLVLAGANPGAFIESILRHGEESDEEAVIYTGEEIALAHAESDEEPAEEVVEETAEEQTNEEEETSAEETVTEEADGEINHSEEAAVSEKTIGDVIRNFDEDEKKVVSYLISQALAGADDTKENQNGNEDNKEETEMKQNAFDQSNQTNENVLTHSAMNEIIAEAKRTGSLKDACLAHGITNLTELFPTEHVINKTPQFMGKDTGWVKNVMNGVHRVPFSRIKALFANISEEDARAKGYIKGKQKKEEVFALLKRTTSPQTVYKLQKLDRDDIIDITTIDIVAFLKTEMRMKLEEELARAFLIGDGRELDAEEKIKTDHIRPIWTDDELYAIHSVVEVGENATMAAIAEEFMDQAVRAREDYEGSGSVTYYMSEGLLTACLLLKDKNGRRIYKDVNEVATAIMAKEIVPVPLFKNKTRVDGEGKTRTLLAIGVNLDDYHVGADKGGEVNMFDDFDLDFNKYEYLIETRCSGSLMKPKSAIVLETVSAEG